MATAIATATVLSLEEHCRRRVDRHLEELLGQDLDEDRMHRARGIAEEVDKAFYDHVEQALEHWRSGR